MSWMLRTSILTICGLAELDDYSARGVTHVLSILDPEWPDHGLAAFGPHHRTTLRFHDAIEPRPGLVLPEPEHVAAILQFGRSLPQEALDDEPGHLLIHCHMGISRSTAAMAILLAEHHPDEDEARIFGRLLEMRPQAWPNSRMLAFADELMGRDGRLTSALSGLYARQLARRPETARYMRDNGRGREVEMARSAG